MCPSLVTPWTVTHQSPLSMEFSRQDYWSWSPVPTPGYLPNRGIKPTSLVSPALAGGFFTTEPPGKPTVTLKRNKTSDPEILLPSEHRAT